MAGIYDTISEVLATDHNIVLPVIQIGCFWECRGVSAELLAEIMGVSTYYPRDNGYPYAGFPVTASERLQEVRDQQLAWAIVEQVGKHGSRVIRRVTDSSASEALNMEFVGSNRIR